MQVTPVTRKLPAFYQHPDCFGDFKEDDMSKK